VGNAGTKGKGLFAGGPIPPRAVVATFRGTPRWIWDIPEQEWPYAFQVGYDRYVLPRRKTRGRYINHSCEPNCVVLGRSIIAERGISRGEELTFDYSSDVDWPGFKMECACGSSRCRKVVRAYRFLPKRLKLRYGRNVTDFIFRRYGVLPSSSSTGQRK
jgi:SET domain-containing protein